MIKIKIKGKEQLFQRGKKFMLLRDKLEKGIVGESEDFGQDIVSISVDRYLSGPRPEKLGRITGRLASSIRSKVKKENNQIKVVVGTNVPYAPVHEFGGKHIRKRPFLKPALDEALPSFKNKLSELLRKVAQSG